MMIFRRFRSVCIRLRQDGWCRTVEFAIFRVAEWWFEKWYGISTAQPVELEEVGIHDPTLREYRPIDYLTLHKILRRLRIRRGTDVFVDFGSGKGRVLVVAAAYSLKSIIGVDLVESFCKRALENIQKARRRLRCRDVKVIATDATAFEIPPDASILFFYNPFGGWVLSQVLGNIRTSLERHPRPHRIVYIRPAGTGLGWVGEQAWLSLTDHFLGILGIEVYLFQVITEQTESGTVMTSRSAS